MKDKVSSELADWICEWRGCSELFEDRDAHLVGRKVRTGTATEVGKTRVVGYGTVVAIVGQIDRTAEPARPIGQQVHSNTHGR